MSFEKVNHPNHYASNDKENVYEAINIIEAYNLNFNIGSAIKYILRAGKKPNESFEVDINKAIWYLKRETSRRKKDED